MVQVPKTSGLAASVAGEKKREAVGAVPHLIIEARAGTGKTTTLVEGLRRVKGLPSKLTPSPQQAVVWDSMALSKGARSVAFVAFNKSIATELQTRVPEGCDAMTMHSMGNRAVSKAFGKTDISQYRVQDIISEITGRDIRELRKYKPAMLKATEELVGLCKVNLVDLSRTTIREGETETCVEAMWVEEQLDKLTSHYDVELNGSREEVYDLVPKVLKRCLDVDRDRCIDFDDMIWLPVVLKLPVFKYDLLLVDEAQDLNRCQQALAKMAGTRLILCGDPCQAIYGFAGADAESMPRMAEELGATPRGCVTLPLTVTRRCGHAIVAEAQQYVPDFEAFKTNPAGVINRSRMEADSNSPQCKRCEGTGRSVPNLKADEEADGKAKCSACDGTGKVLCGSYRNQVKPGDMILCRVNAPLVSQCFKFLKDGRKANIQGRDIGKGLIKLVEKMKADDLPELLMRLDDWRIGEEKKELSKRNPNESKLQAIKDKFECLCCFCDNVKTVSDVIAKINSVFTDDREVAGIRLSSIHKAKGLEARRVFLIRTKDAPLPHPMAKTAWAKKQEFNLLYVAITRAIEEFVYVA